MTRTQDYTANAPAPADVLALPGPTLLEFGTGWCGYCRAAQAPLAAALAPHEDLRHLKVEDGPGRPLGRAYRVKLWPTLIFLRDGQEVTRLVRRDDAETIRQALAQITGAA
ncbi:MAG: thioredoxin family protein [Janthinobacterium lividum]